MNFSGFNVNVSFDFPKRNSLDFSSLLLKSMPADFRQSEHERPFPAAAEAAVLFYLLSLRI